ncbi:MAG: type II toxin-antitoxin system prevent-host-death family antitoxin [Candidatus Dormiibacterota bacterium]
MRVGIRALKQNASEVVRRAAAGEEVEITDRGRPVARILPLARKSGYAQLLAQGLIHPARTSLVDYRPLKVPCGRISGSEALAELRGDER